MKISEKDAILNVNELMNKIKEVRNEIISKTRIIEDAKNHITGSGNSEDEFYNKIVLINSEKIEGYDKFVKVLIKNIMDLKESFRTEKWNEILNNLGRTLALTENIRHVSTSLTNDDYLLFAINETSDQISNVKAQLNSNELSEDLNIILHAELEYYIEDMKTHNFGVARLINEEKGKSK